MLLPGRCRHLTRLGRPTLFAWVLLVVLAHAWVWRDWRVALPEAAPNAPSIDRLKVQLQQPKPLQAPELGPRQLHTRPAMAPVAAKRMAQHIERELKPPMPDGALAPAPTLVPELVPEPATSAGHHGGDIGPEWPLSTRLTYTVTGHYQGPVHGDAQVEWLREGSRYQVRLKLSVGPSLAPFASRELISEGVITPNGIVPQRYVEDTRLLLGPTRRSALRREGDTLWLANGHAVPAPAGMQDSASQFVHLAWVLLTGRVPLEAGQVIELPLALPRGVHTWRYELGYRQFQESAVGMVEVWHLRPLGAPVPGALMAEVWLMPEMEFLPLQILITQNENTWVRLTLAERPLQEAAPENAPSQPTATAP